MHGLEHALAIEYSAGYSAQCKLEAIASTRSRLCTSTTGQDPQSLPLAAFASRSGQTTAARQTLVMAEPWCTSAKTVIFATSHCAGRELRVDTLIGFLAPPRRHCSKPPETSKANPSTPANTHYLTACRYRWVTMRVW
jgi:hypothetical protein